MVKKIPDINEVPSWTQETELPKIPSYQNLRDDVRESFVFAFNLLGPQQMTLDDLANISPPIWPSYYYIPDYKAYIIISAISNIYNFATIQYSIAVYDLQKMGYFHTMDNTAGPIWEKLQELVLGLETK